MWIGDTEVPDELVEAGRTGELVLFVGAGASMEDPSNLPSFSKLTKDIAASASKQVKKKDLKRPDLYLGRLEDEGIKVRETAAALLSPPTSKPNRLHHAIVGLAKTCPSIRVVTTNFDRHLSGALAAQQTTVDEYSAPALPMGDDFEGLVYLHGHLKQPTHRLVLTDKDFGSAYLHDAWAARFLERMFRARVVLFIGYSHSDVVMQYFARALGRQSARYVLTHNPEDRNWQTWGITPVGYQANGTSHAALPVVLEKWGRLASMKRLEHVAHVQEIVSAGIPAIPEEVSYLEATLADAERVRYFTQTAAGAEWLHWAAGRPEFTRLSTGDSDDGIALALAQWVATGFITDEEQSRVALRVMGQRAWAPLTWRSIALRVCVCSAHGGVTAWLRPWVALLIDRDPGARQDRGDLLTTLLTSADWSQDPGTALMLLDHVSRPQLVPLPTFGPEDRPWFDILLRGTEWQLTIAWTTGLDALLPAHLPTILAIVDHRLREACRIIGAANPTTTFDRISYKRVAIDTTGLDIVRDTLDVLIDAGRDLLLRAMESHPGLAEHYLDVWADAEETILVRFAVHVWCKRSDRTPSEKLVWVAGRQWLYRPGIQHEVYRLLQANLPESDPDVARLIVQQALDGPPNTGSAAEHNARRRFDLVSWLATTAPSLPSITEAFSRLKDEHPDWAPDTPTGINARGVRNPFNRSAPFTVEQLHAWIQTDALGAAEKLIEASADWAGPTQEEAFRVLEQCTILHPDNGLALLLVIKERMPSAVPAVIQGWAEASLPDETARRILHELAQMELETFGPTIAYLLTYGIRDSEPTEWHRFNAARILAERVWSALDQPAPLRGTNVFIGALNSPAGRLAEFWIRAVSRDWREAVESWTGLGDRLASILDTMLSSADPKAEHATVVLASDLHFFHAADPQWANARLVPLFSMSADPERALLAWAGLLEGARPTDALGEILLAHYLDAATHEALDTDELRPQLGYHLAWITLYASLAPVTWLRRFAATSRPRIRVLWAQNMARLLKSLDRTAADQEWARWMGEYWGDRVATAQVYVEEASAMAEWVPWLTAHRTEAIDLVIQCPTDITLTSNLLYEISQADLFDRPEDWIRLLDHLLGGAAYLNNWMYLQEIVQKLCSFTPRPNVTPLIEHALRLKIDGAQTWTARP